MANRKTPEDTYGVIEGVAVEKQTTAAKSTRAKTGSGAARGPSGTRRDKQQGPRASGQTSGQTCPQGTVFLYVIFFSISPWRVLVPSPKIVINLPGTYVKLPC